MLDKLAECPANIGPLFGYCDHQLQMWMSRRLRQYDVSPMQCRTMLFLHEATQPVNQKALERFLLVKPSTVNGIVDRLESKGLVRRTASPLDGRCRILELTEAGRRFYQEFAVVQRETAAWLERGLSPEEKEQLRSLLLRVARNLSEEEDDPCCGN